MAYYDKKIVYLSYMSNGSKIKNAGFVRAECRGKDYTLDMRVNGIQEWMEKQYDILAVTPSGKEYAVGRIFLQKGAGQWQAGPLKSANAGNTLSYEEIESLRIDLTDGKTIEGIFRKADTSRAAIQSEPNSQKGEKQGFGKIIWREPEKKEKQGIDKGAWSELGIKEKQGSDKSAWGEPGIREKQGIDKGAWSEPGIKEKQGDDKSIWSEPGIKEKQGSGKSAWYEPEKKEKQGSEKVTWFDLDKKIKQSIEKAARMEPEKDEKRSTEKIARLEQERDEKRGPDTAFSEKKEAAQPELKAGSMEAAETIHMDSAILSDKWQQLMQVYPVVHPYEDERQYVSIEPKDFVIMSGDYQHLANNSFLLHGFYNYRHIILGKEKDAADASGSFYLGVPGVYYEREKMVALMFGFEAFECSGGRAEPGKFGYYLRKVKI